MALSLYRWHKQVFKRSNHKKYHHYFDEWISTKDKNEMLFYKEHWSRDFTNHNK